jgi:hypothetical protein
MAAMQCGSSDQISSEIIICNSSIWLSCRRSRSRNWSKQAYSRRLHGQDRLVMLEQQADRLKLVVASLDPVVEQRADVTTGFFDQVIPDQCPNGINGVGIWCHDATGPIRLLGFGTAFAQLLGGLPAASGLRWPRFGHRRCHAGFREAVRYQGWVELFVHGSAWLRDVGRFGVGLIALPAIETAIRARSRLPGYIPIVVVTQHGCK